MKLRAQIFHVLVLCGIEEIQSSGVWIRLTRLLDSFDAALDNLVFIRTEFVLIHITEMLIKEVLVSSPTCAVSIP